MAEVTLPTQMQYFPPAVAARARSYRQTVTPMNGTAFRGSDKIKLVLGTTPGTYLNTLNSYLEFDIVNTTKTATNTLTIDKHASCVIDRIEVYHAGALIDQLNNVNVLYSVLLDAGVSFADMQSTHVTGGVEDIPPLVKYSANTDYPTGAPAADEPEMVDIYASKGRSITANTDGDAHIHVALSLLGLLSPAGLDRYLPLGDAVNGNVEIHIYLASTAQGLISDPKDQTWELRNVEYQATLVEIDAAVHAALVQSIGGIYSLPYNSWRHYSNNIAATVSSHTMYIATKVSSLSGMIVCMRDQDTVNKSELSSVGDRTRDKLKSAQLRIGALNFPLKPVTCDLVNGDQALVESLKMFGKLGTSMGGTSISRANYLGTTAAGVGSTKFFLGFDTQAYSAASMAVDDGVQAQHGSTYLQLEFDAGGAAKPLVVDVFILFDGMLTVANGAISAAF